MMRYSMLNIQQLLAMIGEGFGEYSDEICGAVVNIRGKGDKLALWTKHCNDGEATLNIGWDRPRPTIPIRIILSLDLCHFAIVIF